jgi:hypothetical protein
MRKIDSEINSRWEKKRYARGRIADNPAFRRLCPDVLASAFAVAAGRRTYERASASEY